MSVTLIRDGIIRHDRHDTQVATAMLGGQLSLAFVDATAAYPHIKSDKINILAITGAQRHPALPQVPTFKELGLEPVNRMAYYGIVGPKGMPREVVDKLNAAVRKVLEDPAVRKRIEDTGSLIVADTPERFGAQIKAEYEVYQKVVAEQKLAL